MKWITRERPKIDRIACPWLVARFIDQEPEFLYVRSSDVLSVAGETEAIPYDIPGVELTHEGELCSFDAFLKKYGLDDPALQQLALIVRGADTSRLELTPQSAGPVRAIARAIARLRRRSRDAQARHGDVRRAVCVVQALPERIA